MPPRVICDCLTTKAESSLKDFAPQTSLDFLNRAEPEYPDQTLLTH